MSLSITSLEGLLEHAVLRQERFAKGPVFSALVRRDVLDDARKRSVVLSCARRFSSNFQMLLFARQALCVDPKYYGTFLRHLNEEIGHDKLLSGEGAPEAIQDTVFEALVSWFSYQMIVLDNAEKAALMHLVLEAAGDQFHVLAAPLLRDQVRSGYFDVHAEADVEHAHMGTALLSGLGAETYQRLSLVVDRGWDMMEATFARVYQLTTDSEPGPSQHER